jgi:hypothetical protein
MFSKAFCANTVWLEHKRAMDESQMNALINLFFMVEYFKVGVQFLARIVPIFLHQDGEFVLSCFESIFTVGD